MAPVSVRMRPRPPIRGGSASIDRFLVVFYFIFTFHALNFLVLYLQFVVLASELDGGRTARH